MQRIAASLVLVLVLVLVLASGLLSGSRLALAQPADELSATTIVYARGAALYKSDARGKGEVELVTLPKGAAVRALRTDAAATVLLADVGGKWSWMPLDGQAKALVALPCGDGPAQLATDGTCVLCRNSKQPAQSVIVLLKTGKGTPVAVPSLGARLIGAGADRRLVWADKGIWSALAASPTQKTLVAPEAPLRGFLPSPDGARAVGVYTDVPLAGTPGATAKAKPAELLMSFALDGVGARRKVIRSGVAVEWSHDSQWVLVQDGGSACIMRAVGGQYKCWRGFTAASIAPSGAYALLLGAQKPDKAAPKGKQAAPPKQAPKQAAPKQAPPKQPAKEGAKEGESDEPEDADHADGGGAPIPVDDVAVPPPTGPLSLYRAKLDGPYTEAPILLVKLVDGAAVWLPKP
ncbi:MAG TPA: hypothetical protein VNO30_50150 [Kofleriaceae bacterium]|nr:hypothetical protein [Kofleriaceae bacterium]